MHSVHRRLVKLFATKTKVLFTIIIVTWVVVTPKTNPKTTTMMRTNTSVYSKFVWTICFPERFPYSLCIGGSSPHSRCQTWEKEALGKYCRRWARARYFRKECSFRRKTWRKYIFPGSKKFSRLQTEFEIINKQHNIV